MWRVRLYFEHCRLTDIFLFEYRKDFQKIQALINWRNSLLIKERYRLYIYMYTVVSQFNQSCFTRHVQVYQVSSGYCNNWTFFIIREAGHLMARTLECCTPRIKWSWFEPWPGRCVGTWGKKRYSQGASLHPHDLYKWVPANLKGVRDEGGVIQQWSIHGYMYMYSIPSKG